MRARPGGAMLAVEHRTTTHNRGDCVFEDQLFLAVVFQEHGILIERTNFPGELNSTHEINCDGCFVFTNCIQESVLNILRRLVVHVPISFSDESPGFFNCRMKREFSVGWPYDGKPSLQYVLQSAMNNSTFQT
jgi:hypothetical protein